jgi:TPR repeat protein
VGAARKFFERAADLGLAQSAVALAATYDPDEVVKLNIVGLATDVQTARKWYEKARELGAAEAVERLQRLGTSGFVAVLATRTSRTEVLKAFVYLQQEYTEALAAKTPDVLEVNLGDKGVWYRAFVGPPGSREAATSVCDQLAAAGHSGCWVMAY